MSIRLRTVNGVRVALCAVESDPTPGDVYLDDADHHALSTKFALDFNSEGLEGPQPFDEVVAAAMETQKIRDAKDEAEKWSNEIDRRGMVRCIVCTGTKVSPYTGNSCGLCDENGEIALSHLEVIERIRHDLNQALLIQLSEARRRTEKECE